jgi:hypothetical protein
VPLLDIGDIHKRPVKNVQICGQTVSAEGDTSAAAASQFA